MEVSSFITEPEVCLLMQLACWRALEDVDPSLATFFSMSIPWQHLFRYLGDVYRERAHVVLTSHSRHLFLMSSSPDLMIHFVLPAPIRSNASPPSSPGLQGHTSGNSSASTEADATGGAGPRLFVCRRLKECSLHDQRQEEEDLTILVNTLCTFLTRLLLATPPTSK